MDKYAIIVVLIVGSMLLMVRVDFHRMKKIVDKKRKLIYELKGGIM